MGKSQSEGIALRTPETRYSSISRTISLFQIIWENIVQFSEADSDNGGEIRGLWQRVLNSEISFTCFRIAKADSGDIQVHQARLSELGGEVVTLEVVVVL